MKNCTCRCQLILELRKRQTPTWLLHSCLDVILFSDVFIFCYMPTICLKGSDRAEQCLIFIRSFSSKQSLFLILINSPKFPHKLDLLSCVIKTGIKSLHLITRNHQCITVFVWNITEFIYQTSEYLLDRLASALNHKNTPYKNIWILVPVPHLSL